jgi:hypothetical protein
MKLKPGDIINIDGVDCILDEGNIGAITVWKKVFELDCRDENDIFIHFYSTKGEEISFSPSRVLTAIKKAETINWNRSPQGL